MTAFSYGSLPKISVIIAVRNAAASIGHALDSLAAQHYPKLEVIVWDGQSTDGTQAVLERYDTLITASISEMDDGPPDACNRAYALATGDLIGHVNADDECEPGLLWAVAEAHMREPRADVISAGIICRTRDRHGRRIVTGYFADERQLALTLDAVLSELPTFMLSRFVKRELKDRIGPWNVNRESWYVSNDREWTARLALANPRNVIIPKALYGFDVSAGSISSNSGNFTRIIDEHCMIAGALLARDDLDTTQRRSVERWRKRQLAYGLWKSVFALQWSKARFYSRDGVAHGGWSWPLLCIRLLACRLSRKLMLKLSGGIDRGYMP